MELGKAFFCAGLAVDAVLSRRVLEDHRIWIDSLTFYVQLATAALLVIATGLYLMRAFASYLIGLRR